MVVIGAMLVNLEACLQWYSCVSLLPCDRYFDGIVLSRLHDVGSAEYLVSSCSFAAVAFARNATVAATS